MRDEIKTKPAESLVIRGFSYNLNTDQLRDPSGNIIHMRRQSAEVLAMLAQHSGEIVSKEHLVAHVWPAGVATDDSLVQCIADIRRTLTRDAIETYPKKGYKLNATVEQLTTAQSDKKRMPVWPMMALVVGIASIVVTNYWLKKINPKTTENNLAISKENTLAVLPFVTLGDDQDMTYFAEGLSDDLTTDLSKVSDLTVISYASSFDFQNAESQFAQIAQDLGARYLVRGTVRSQSDQIRINVSLVDSSEGFNVWAERYERQKHDPFAVQSDITRKIVEALSLELDAKATQHARVEPDAYYMLLRGLQPLRDSSLLGNAKAREHFQRALTLEPDYARAHASIALTYARDTVLSDAGEDSAAVEKGLEAAIRAIQLDADIPHAYYALGVLNLAIRQYDNALGAARHAIRLDSNYSDGYALLAEVSLYGGDLNEALIAIEKAKRLHPHHSADYDWIEAHILYQLGEYATAQPILERAAAVNQQYTQGMLLLAANYSQLGEQASALKVITESRIETNPELAVKPVPYRTEARRENLLAGLRKVELAK